MRATVVLLSACLLSSCEFPTPEESPGILCLEYAARGVLVTLEDKTGEPIDGASLTIEEGSYLETLVAMGKGAYVGATERPGSYLLRVSATGFAAPNPIQLNVVDGTCHVIPAQANIVLEN